MAPRMVDKEARRREILAAAVRVFARKGYAEARIEDVAAEAGLAKGTIYLSFPGREALLAGVFEEYAARSAAVLDALGEGPALTRLERLVRGTVETLAGHRDHAIVMLRLWATAPPLDMAAVYGRHREVIADLLRQAAAEGALRPGVGERHATLVVGLIEGCLLQWLADPAVDLAGLADDIVALGVEGVRA
ncbi:TetR/AcrR family transcriptional regulator [Bailinhaonella thermotolerans]|uniref:TetR/AcrR family transcriptional regulator n=1 Tax=Bailinhaonella thermotolerans TaxID=1070861 RepID=A0A3A4A548_9ACTN|nr:TetR/AcrR family transcriptional regulator [Bailinhaonella thermotolerans]RJL19502.1 TetR/AcrR family transcriptional regulator [Bailinhaonella thermotolerans]